MTSILNSVQELSSYAVPMIVLLGLLIFVHELGHFLVAKYFKVRVEVFSLGFGPKLFKFKRGDTVYAISAIPLGGYVKMFGDDPSAEVSAEQKSYSFLHKPVGQRIAVVLAGPIMNLFFAIVLFMAVALLGEQALSPKVGDVAPESAAYAAGFRPGDTVISVDGKPVVTWEEVQKTIEANPEKDVAFDVENTQGVRNTIHASPKLTANKNILSWDREVGEIDGLSYSARASVVGVSQPKSAAAESGLKTGDLVMGVEGVKIDKWRDFVTELAKHSSKGEIKLEVARGAIDLDRKDKDKEPTPESMVVKVPADAQGKSGEAFAQALGLEFPELYLAGMEAKSPAAVAGLLKGDRLLSINGEEVKSFEQVAGIIRAFGKNHGDGATEPLNIKVLRSGEEKQVAVSPSLKERMTTQGKEERRFEIGIRPMIVDAPPASFAYKTTNPVQALVRGVELTAKWTSFTVLSFVRMFQAEVSAKNIGGFLSIGQMAKRSWQVGPSQFLMAMAIISINLFILNLLPVPVLDGGHLVFYSIEAVKGAPLSLRKMELAQQVGLVLLLGLMVFALFNDFSRLFGGNS
jgi:regulator of sigma E protease